MLTFKLGAGWVIPGLEEGVWSMRAGGTRKIMVPPELAYGDIASEDSKIPANSTLLFEVALVPGRGAPLSFHTAILHCHWLPLAAVP
jgi:FKBP-type peptidyl-prolyl cis-trans isomerase